MIGHAAYIQPVSKMIRKSEYRTLKPSIAFVISFFFGQDVLDIFLDIDSSLKRFKA